MDARFVIEKEDVNQVEIKLNVKDVFDCNNDFEMIIFQAFTAKSDIVRVNVLMQKAEKQSDLFFLFKIMLGLLRESEELIRLIVKDYKANLQCFNNWDKISEAIEKYVQINNGIEKDSFSYIVLRAIRNQVFHYKEIEELQKYFPNISDNEETITIGDTEEESNFDFTDSVLFEYISNESEAFNGSRDITEFIDKVAQYSIHITDLLKILIDGYLEKYTYLIDDHLIKKQPEWFSCLTEQIKK